MIFCCCRLRKVNKPSKSLQRFVSISGLSVYLVPFLILKQLFSKVVIKTSMLSKSTLKSIFLWIKLNLSSSYTSSVNTGVKIERLLLWRPLSSMFLLFFVFFVVLVFISVSVLQYYTRGGEAVALHHYLWLRLQTCRDGAPLETRAVFLCSFNNRSVLQSIQLQWQDESVQSGLQRIRDFWLIYCRNDQLLVARSDFRSQPPAAPVRVMSFTVKIKPPVEELREEEDGLCHPLVILLFLLFYSPSHTPSVFITFISVFLPSSVSEDVFLGTLETNSSVCVVLSRALFSDVPVAACCSAFSFIAFFFSLS